MVRKTVKQNVKKSKASRKITKTIKTKILGGAVKQNIINVKRNLDIFVAFQNYLFFIFLVPGKL